MEKTWMDKPVYVTKKSLDQAKIPKGVWEKCSNCSTQQMVSKLIENHYVCDNCQHHLYMPMEIRIKHICDQKSFKEVLKKFQSQDPLGFDDGKSSYLNKISASMKSTGTSEAVVTGTATINEHSVVLAIMEFKFIGGSMGSVVGEKIYQAMRLAIAKKSAFIAITASGGARMQEGLISLMQMAKTCIGAQEMGESQIPFIVIMTHPTMGGVTASFASVADIIIAEPRAAIGFAGRRVIEDTIKEKLPENFQTSEYLYERGFVDMIVNRKEMKMKLSEIIEILLISKKKLRNNLNKESN